MISTLSVAAMQFSQMLQLAQHMPQCIYIFKSQQMNHPTFQQFCSKLTKRGHNPVQSYSSTICSDVELPVISNPPHTTQCLLCINQANNEMKTTSSLFEIEIPTNVWSHSAGRSRQKHIHNMFALLAVFQTPEIITYNR